METLPGELKRGVLMKQGHFVKSWRERLFILSSDRLSYFENNPGVSGVQSKGVILLSDVITCTAQQGYSFSMTVGGAASATPVEYLLLALTEKDR